MRLKVPALASARRAWKRRAVPPPAQAAPKRSRRGEAQRITSGRPCGSPLAEHAQGEQEREEQGGGGEGEVDEDEGPPQRAPAGQRVGPA